MRRNEVLPAAPFDIAAFGELISEPSRVAMLLSLFDGQARPASELAAIGGVAPSTASTHLQRLLDGGLLTAERRGRHRYFQLAGEEVAAALEAMALVQQPDKKPRTENDPRRRAIARARTCFHHLAGRLGVDWFRALHDRNFLRLEPAGVALTDRGIRTFQDLGLHPEHTARWPAGKLCLDWTERKNHLGGKLGALLTQHLFDQRWVARTPAKDRSVRLTARGRRGLELHFGLTSEV